MKINVEVDMTPDELRRFMGLPDVHDLQQNMLDQFAQGLQQSAEQRNEFMQDLFTNAMAPWQTFARAMANPPSSTKSRSKDGSK